MLSNSIYHLPTACSRQLRLPRTHLPPTKSGCTFVLGARGRLPARMVPEISGSLLRAMDMKLTVPVALIGGSIFLSGCCSIVAPKTTARVVAAPHTRPIIRALAKYHKDEQEYPDSLQFLLPDYLSGDLEKRTRRVSEHGQRWAIDYKRIDPQTYELSFNHAFHDVYYRNGEVTRASSNPFR